uniref:ATP-dependent DNA helicase n=1 Tax=Tanacetum cinerariifolium TaxID=118510 RepID=A0A6L2L050_TANCI|nr:DNA helicase [Tanacetum cinerariifolium]
MLLCHRKGCKSFTDIRTFDGTLYPTNKAACKALGLLGGDEEWIRAFQEAALSATSSELRRLFALENSSDPTNRKNEKKMKASVLFDLEVMLNSYSKSLKDFGLPPPPEDMLPVLQNRLLMEETNYNPELLLKERNLLIPRLNEDQKLIFKSRCTEAYICIWLWWNRKDVSLEGHYKRSMIRRKNCDGRCILRYCIAVMPLGFKTHTLKKNMRLYQSRMTEAEKVRIEDFSTWLLNIGDGTIGETNATNSQDTFKVDLSNELCIPDSDTEITDLINFIYDDSTFQTPTPRDLQKKVIVCPKNESTDMINARVLTLLNTQQHVYRSSDEATPHGNDGGRMDDPNITIEEYIRLEEEKAQDSGKVFNWDTTKYGKIWFDEDIHDLRSIETKFPSITFNDEVSSKKTLSCEPTVSSLNDEINFRVSFDDSYNEDYTDAQMSKSDLLTKSILSPHKVDEFNSNDETSVSEYDKEEQNVLYFNDLFPFNIIHPNDFKSEKDNDDNEIDIIQSSKALSLLRSNDMALPTRNQRHQYLRYEGLQYTYADNLDFESRLNRIHKREVHRVQVFDFEGLPDLMAEGLSARMLMKHKNDQGIRISSAGDFLGTTPSYIAIRDLILRLCHRLIAYSIAGRSQAPEKVAAAGALEAAEDAPAIDEGSQADLAPILVPQQPPPPPPPAVARTVL